jgi:nicotinamide-nucleotide amidase
MSGLPRAGVVVTGTEVLNGRVRDANGPWLADRLTELGIDHATTIVVGDRPEDMREALRWLAARGMALIVTSGGLGPTADDLTADIVADFQGRPMALDAALEGRIAAKLEHLMHRFPDLDLDAWRLGTRKQALVPTGATVLEPVGTAPGLVVPAPEGSDGPTVLVLPGPPPELQAMWPAALEAQALRDAIAGAGRFSVRTLRMYGMPESEIAETLRIAEGRGIDLDALEITTCLRRGEIEVVTRYEPGAQGTYDALEEVVRERHAGTLFSDDGSTIDELVARALLDQGATIATAESCTGGLLAARLTERAGSSAYVLGGVVAYANSAKVHLVGVEPELITRHGAVSVEVAEALALGALRRFDADIGVGITGVAGPGGGTEAKPVGFVCLSLASRDGRRITRAVTLPGGRADIRDRSTTVALHLLRRLLHGEGERAAVAAA